MFVILSQTSIVMIMSLLESADPKKTTANITIP